MKPNTIRQLVKAAFESNQYHELQIGSISKDQSKMIKEVLNEDLSGCKRFMDVYAIKHCISNHGFEKTEKSRGQEAITLDDFENVPLVLKSPDKVEYAGKNRLKQDLVRYTKRMNGLYVVVEAVRVKKQGNKLYFQTMWKRK